MDLVEVILLSMPLNRVKQPRRFLANRLEHVVTVSHVLQFVF